MSLRSAILVAAPQLIDPNFHRTVVLIASHDDDGALGLVLNRMTDITVSDLLATWSPILVSPDRAFAGGPVQQEVAIGIGRLKAGAHAPGGHAWTGIAERVGLVDLASDEPETIERIESVRVFSGYAGWGPGQLEGEIEGGDWFVVPFHPDDPFRPEVDQLWTQVLRRQPGRLAMFAHFPVEPRWN